MFRSHHDLRNGASRRDRKRDKERERGGEREGEGEGEGERECRVGPLGVLEEEPPESSLIYIQRNPELSAQAS